MQASVGLKLSNVPHLEQLSEALTFQNADLDVCEMAFTGLLVKLLLVHFSVVDRNSYCRSCFSYKSIRHCRLHMVEITNNGWLAVAYQELGKTSNGAALIRVLTNNGFPVNSFILQ